MNAQVTMSGAQAQARLTLAQLALRLERVQPRVVGDQALAISGVFQDSRRVLPGAMFAARRGDKQAGLDYWTAARARGAVALLRQTGSEASSAAPGLEVNDVRLAIALAAEAIYGDPSQALSLVGITGTNGKTTSAWLTQLAIDASGARAGRLGTLGFAFAGEELPGALTTPEADDVSRIAARVVSQGGTHLVMEVSSHALVQARVDALRFEVAAFTNLTQDHLDYHSDMRAYGNAKRRLLIELKPRHRVINIDDPFGQRLSKECDATTVSSRRKADVYAEDVSQSDAGLKARLHVGKAALQFKSRLTGLFNLDNVLLSLGIVKALGLELEPAVLALERSTGVPGRFERCDLPGDEIAVLVDYAHTPVALERLLLAAQSASSSRLLCVFGCGGDRDAGKRPQMGAIAGRLASRVIVTNDNPRSEEPMRIADAIVAGLRGQTATFEVLLDRAQAIQQAILEANPGDVVVIAGKGHEPYQLVGDQVLSFDDRECARLALALRRGQRV